MALTYLQLQNRVMNKVGDQSTAMRTRVKDWLNEAQIEVCSKINVPHLETSYDAALTTTEAGVSIPDDFIRELTVAVQGTSMRVLTPVNRVAQDYRWPDLGQTGTGLPLQYKIFYRPYITTSFSVTIATPGVFTQTAHGLVEGDRIIPASTGALPTGLTAGSTYYIIATGLTANAFQVSATKGGTAVNTSGTQSGVHTYKGVSIKRPSLEVMPVAASGYTVRIRYVAQPVDMSGDGDYSSLGIEYDNMIVAFACAEALTELGSPLAETYSTRYEKALEFLRGEQQEAESNGMIVGSPGELGRTGKEAGFDW